MKRLFLIPAASAGIFAIAMSPTTAAAGTCEMELVSNLSSCNGDNVCEWFAYVDYDICISNEDPPTTTPGGPPGAP